MRTILSTLFAISGLILVSSAASVHAQQSSQDFQLPPAPSPSATPQVEGPVDDSGIIPVGPRVLTPTPTASPTASATPTPSPAQTQSSQPQQSTTDSRPLVQPIPATAGAERETRAPSQRRTPQSTPSSRSTQPASGQTEAALENSAVEQASNVAGEEPAETSPTQTPTIIAPQTAETPTAKAGPSDLLPNSWLWWAAGLAAALLALVLGWFFRQRSAAQPANAGLAQNPRTSELADTAPGHESAAAGKPNLALQLEIEQLSRSVMAMTLKCRIALSNRSDRALRDISVCADLVCANRQLPMDAQIASEASFLPEFASEDRIAPHKTQSVSAMLTIPNQQIAAFKHRDRPMFVPLVRVRIDCKDHEPIFRTFVVGIAADPKLQSSSKLHPVPLDGIPGSYQGVRSRPLAQTSAA